MADPYFSSVVGLWHFDGTNGATTFTDSSSKGHTLTGGTNYTLTTAQQKFGTGSLDIAGNGTAANTADSDDWWFGSGQFTIEMWVRTPSISSTDVVISQWGATPSNTYNFRLRFDNGGNFGFDYCPTGAFASIVTIAGTYTPPANTWVHIAVDRDVSNVLRLYADGVVKASATAASAFFNSSQVLAVGNTNDGASRFFGQVDELRITKGVARYAGAFTPPTAPFDAFGPPTYAYLGGLGREALVAEVGSVKLGGLSRETLVSGVTPVLLSTLAREVLLVSPPPPAGPRLQTSVTVTIGAA